MLQLKSRDQPDGQISGAGDFLSSPILQKYFAFPVGQIKTYKLPPSTSQRGVS